MAYDKNGQLIKTSSKDIEMDALQGMTLDDAYKQKKLGVDVKKTLSGGETDSPPSVAAVNSGLANKASKTELATGLAGKQAVGDYATKSDLIAKANKTDVNSSLATKQDKLVSGTNLKTINNQSLLGSGNITIQGGGGSVDIDTSIPASPTDTKVPSTKLLVAELAKKANAGSGGLANPDAKYLTYTDGDTTTSGGTVADKLTELDGKVGGEKNVEYPMFVGGGINLSNATEKKSNIRCKTRFIAARKGDEICVKNWNVIGKIYVFEFSKAHYSNVLTPNPNAITSGKYVVSNDDTRFIRITASEVDANAVIISNEHFYHNVYILHKTNVEPYKVNFNAEIPSGWWVANKTEFTSTAEVNAYKALHGVYPEGWENSSNGVKLTLDKIYEGWDKLLTDYPEYVSREELGFDQSGQYPIYKYIFKPITMGIASNRDVYDASNAPYPTFVMDFCIHGNEHPNARAALNLFTHICRDWRESEHLAYLRFNVQFVVIPIANPWGYVNHNRRNSRDVDLNRNFYSMGRWTINDGVTEEHPNNAGTSALSELETQYVNRMQLDYADADGYFSFHAHGVFTAYCMMIAYAYSGDVYANNIVKPSISNINGMMSSGIKNHELPYSVIGLKDKKSPNNVVENGTIGTLSVSQALSTASSNSNSLGIYACGAPEVIWRYYDGNTSANYNINTDCMNQEFIANFILEILRQRYL